MGSAQINQHFKALTVQSCGVMIRPASADCSHTSSYQSGLSRARPVDRQPIGHLLRPGSDWSSMVKQAQHPHHFR